MNCQQQHLIQTYSKKWGFCHFIAELPIACYAGRSKQPLQLNSGLKATISRNGYKNIGMRLY